MAFLNFNANIFFNVQDITAKICLDEDVSKTSSNKNNLRQKHLMTSYDDILRQKILPRDKTSYDILR